WLNINLANALEKNPVEAAGFYRVALAVRPGNSAAYNNLGVALMDEKKLDEAIAAYRKAIEIDPKGAMAHSNLGNALPAQGKLDGAIAAYRKAIELGPKLVNAHINLGNALVRKGWELANHPDPKFRDPKRAVELGKEGVELDSHSLSWQYFGWIQYRAVNGK